MADIDILRGVINALNGVEVKGKENLDRVLGSIRALETIVSRETIKGEEVKKNG